MISEAIGAIQELIKTLDGKSVGFTLFVGLFTWVAARLVKRVDGHDTKIDSCKEDISELKEADKVLDMQLSAQRSETKSDIIRLESDLEDSESRTNKLIAANTENTEKYMSLMSQHFQDLISVMKKGKDD